MNDQVRRRQPLILTSFALIIATIPIQDTRTFFASTVYTITGTSIHSYNERKHSRMLNLNICSLRKLEEGSEKEYISLNLQVPSKLRIQS